MSHKDTLDLASLALLMATRNPVNSPDYMENIPFFFHRVSYIMGGAGFLVSWLVLSRLETRTQKQKGGMMFMTERFTIKVSSARNETE